MITRRLVGTWKGHLSFTFAVTGTLTLPAHTLCQFFKVNSIIRFLPFYFFSYFRLQTGDITLSYEDAERNNTGQSFVFVCLFLSCFLSTYSVVWSPVKSHLWPGFDFKGFADEVCNCNMRMGANAIQRE